MKIERELVPESTLEEFALKHDLTMFVTERDAFFAQYTRSRYCAYFKNCEIKGDGVLIGSHGNGDTEDAALEDYMREISEKTLVIDAYRETRREIKAPRFTAVWRAVATKDAMEPATATAASAAP